MALGLNKYDTSGTPQTDAAADYTKLKQDEEQKRMAERRAKCINRGGTWDEATGTCSLPQEEEASAFTIKQEKTTEETPVTPTKLSPEQKAKAAREGIPVITDRFGNERIQTPEMLAGSKQDVERLQAEQGGIGAAQALQFQQQQQAEIAAGQELAGQVGQFGQTGITPTGLDWGEAATEGVVSGIPSTLKWLGGAAVGGAAIGGAVGTAGGPIGVPIGAVVGGVIGVIGGLSSSMISNMKSQRRDTTTAQQRVLDEGKQTMKDWATLAETDPGNKARYLTEYNKVSAQIDQAYRQMKLDTANDVGKFETALPNLAEFEAFYAAGGERDTLDVEMRNALTTPTTIDYKMMELYERRS